MEKNKRKKKGENMEVRKETKNKEERRKGREKKEKLKDGRRYIILLDFYQCYSKLPLVS